MSFLVLAHLQRGISRGAAAVGKFLLWSRGCVPSCHQSPILQKRLSGSAPAVGWVYSHFFLFFFFNKLKSCFSEVESTLILQHQNCWLLPLPCLHITYFKAERHRTVQQQAAELPGGLCMLLHEPSSPKMGQPGLWRGMSSDSC